MNLKAAFILLFLFTTVTLVGCYTKLGYYEPANLKEKQEKRVEKGKKEITQTSDSDLETEGYYGRRKPGYSSSYSDAYDSYWVPYAAYPSYAYYPPMYYSPHPWYYGYGYYGYHAPYYRHYRGYYPYRGYYGRYYGSTYYPTSRSTYKKGYRSENRRSRVSRSVTSSNPRSERPQRIPRNRNEN
ncbi:MAG: hypothetical protein OXM61_16360 [Candidatus Poribacteria bacterium]|nr:hypothetical protein [Candidatus Poribacteria bacterium]